MAKRIEINIPCEGGETRTATGRVIYLPIGDRKRVKLFLQDRPGYTTPILTHYASGQKFSDLNALALRLFRSGGRYSDRGLAEVAVYGIVRRVGADKVLATLDAAPVINK